MKSIKKQYEQSYLDWYKAVFINLSLIIINGENYRAFFEILKTIFMFLLVVVLFISWPVTGLFLAWFTRRSFREEHKKLYQETIENQQKKASN